MRHHDVVGNGIPRGSGSPCAQAGGPRPCHLSDLEFIRKHWKRVFYEEIVDPDDSTRQAKLLRPKVLTAKELRDLAASYKDIQLGQRLIFGENTYVVGLKSGKDERAADIPDEVVRKLEDALAIVAADPGEPFGAGPDEDE
jgi:hypothetical protein